MRIARISLVGALLLGAAACQTEDGSAVAPNIPPLAFVRYINAVPDTNNLTVRWVDQIDFTPMSFVNVPFRGLGQGGYQGLEAGSRHFRVFTHDPRLSSNTTEAVTAQMADTTFTFAAGQYYTLLHLGYARTGAVPAQRVLIINDAIPATSATIMVRAIHSGLGLPAVDVFATATATTALSGAPLFSNVAVTNGTAGVSGYATRATGQFALQAAATGTTTSILGSAAPTGTAGTTSADPIAGATIGGSVLTAIAFPAAVTGSRAASITFSEASGRVIDNVTAVAGGYEVRDLTSAGWATNRFAQTANSSWDVILTPATCATVTAPSTVKCETRPAAVTARITGNGAGTVTTAANVSTFLVSAFRDTVKTPVVSGRAVDTVYAVAGGYEVRDSVAASWTVNQFAQNADTSWIITLTPPACPTVTAPTTIACEPRPAATTVRITGNGAGTVITAANLAAYAKSWFSDTVTTPTSTPSTQIVRSARTRFAITRDVARQPVRSTFAITGNNPPLIVWFSDRQPARTTTP